MSAHFYFYRLFFIFFQMARAVWLYYMCKITELLDTVFFVLRKKQNQVSFLHLYHHTLMPICGFIGIKYFAGKYHSMAYGDGSGGRWHWKMQKLNSFVSQEKKRVYGFNLLHGKWSVMTCVMQSTQLKIIFFPCKKSLPMRDESVLLSPRFLTLPLHYHVDARIIIIITMLCCARTVLT